MNEQTRGVGWPVRQWAGGRVGGCRRRWSQFTDEVSAVGPHYVFSARLAWWRRVVWAVLVVAAVGVMVYQVGDRVAHYRSSPSTMLLYIRDEKLLRLPAITICSNNFLRWSYVNGTDGLDELARITDECLNYYPLCHRRGTDGGADAVARHDDIAVCCDAATLALPNVYTHVHMTQGSHQLGRLLPYLALAGNPIYRGTHREEQAAEFEYQAAMMREFGQCYTLNSAPSRPLVMHVPGVSSALVFIINLDSAEYAWSGVLTSVGMMLHDADDVPDISNNPVNVGGGSLFSITIEASSYHLQPEVSGCVAEGGGEQQLAYSSPPYTMAKCRRDCALSKAYGECKCIMYYWPRFEHFTNVVGMRECSTLEEYFCFEHAHRDLQASGAIADCECPRACNTLRYKWQVQTAPKEDNMKYCGLVMLDKQGRLIPNESCSESDMVLGRLYYNQMTTEVIKQELSYSITALLSDIGGAMGIALGCTLLTFYEILEYLLFDLII